VPTEPTTVPLGLANFAKRDMNIVHWSEFDRCGHHAPQTASDLLVDVVRAFFRRLR
jgi:hypothetical protein